MVLSARRVLAATAVTGFLGSGALYWQLLSPEGSLEGSFRQALAQYHGPQSAKPAAKSAMTSDTFGAGLWLSGLDVPSAGDETQPMEIGSRLAITARDGATRYLQVVDIRPMSAPIRDVSETVPASLTMVTLRPVGQASGGEIRVFVETATPTKPTTAPARAL